MFEDIINRSL